MTAHAFATEGLTECPFMPVFGPPQIMFVKGRGTELWDSDGKRYLDFLGGLAVIGLGHANPVVAAAIAEQANELLHVSNLFANPVATKAAIEIDRLLAEATGYSGQVFFTNSGAEANECALKLARKHGGRGRHVVVSALGSFHGRTLATLAATGQPTKHEPFQPMPEGFHHVAWGDVDAIAKAVDATVAAVLIEPVQGEGGVNEAPEGYLAAIREICDQTGALMMLDEIQSGFGRAQQAPIGMPLPIALASVTTSGTTPSCSKPNQRPVRPKPVWISSSLSSAPVASQISRIAER